MPVLPEVASSRILSCVSAPLRSPSAIIRAAGRSLTEPPGFFHSAFAYSSTLRRPASKPDSRISGVFPIKSTTEAAVRGSPGVATDISDCFSRKLYPTPNSQRPTPKKGVQPRKDTKRVETNRKAYRRLGFWILSLALAGCGTGTSRRQTDTPSNAPPKPLILIQKVENT